MYAANPETGTLFKLEEDEGVGTYIMNSKDLNLASHMQEILGSGVVDSIKVEGRTKTAYYAATTAKAYRMALNDFYDGKLDSEKYQYELQSLQNRGYTDAYLISRPFEKHDTQSLDFSMQYGTHQVSGIVNEEGDRFLSKYKTLPNDEMEVVFPLGSKVAIVDNEVGSTYEKDGKFFMRMKRLKAQNGKIWDEIHSGNVNEIELPTSFPPYTFFRVPITDQM
jgi:U32 family peptidase